MIYKDELIPYRKTSNEKKPDIGKAAKFLSYQHILLYASAFFASRVFILGSIMPFGISFFVACFGVLERGTAMITGIAAALGYLSALKGYISLNHLVTIAILMGYAYIMPPGDKKRIYKLSIAAFIISIPINLMFHVRFISGGIVKQDIILAVVESLVIAAASYIFSYGMPVYFENNKRKVLSSEETVFIGIMLAIVISGMWDIKYMGFSLKNMMAFFIVLSTGYIEGPAMGAAVGSVLGLVSSMADASMPIMLGIFAFSGLIAGVFKELGKVVTSIACVATAALMGFYTSGVGALDGVFLDSIIPAFIFLFIPVKSFEKMSLLINGDKKILELHKSYVQRVKDMMEMRLESISTMLYSLCGILEENVDNELSYKGEINGIVEKLTDRVCSNCDSKSVCWKKELYYTYDSFLELLRLIEKSGRLEVASIPQELRRKCIRPNELVKQANYIYEIFRVNNKWRRKLIKSRMIVSDQIKGVSGLVKSMVEEVSTSMEFKNDVEEEVAIALDKKGLDFDDIVAVKNKSDRYEVTIYKRPCAGKQVCGKEYTSVISRVIGKRMMRDGSQCRLSRDSSMCHFRLIEGENFNMNTAVSRMSKEEVSGDNYSFGEMGQGRYMMAISDGMGSGVPARMESNTTISLLEKFIEAGYEKDIAIKAINSVLVFKSSSESFSTIDLALVDLYSGMGEFVKVGAAPTFIKSRGDVVTIRSTSLPAGILDDVNLESEFVQLKNGDMVVMISDGVADAGGQIKEKWVANFLRDFESVNPSDVAEAIINRAKEMYGGKVMDDMTVLVSKIWKLM